MGRFVFLGMWTLHMGYSLLYFNCHTDPVRLAEHLQRTHKSEKKKMGCCVFLCCWHATSLASESSSACCPKASALYHIQRCAP